MKIVRTIITFIERIEIFTLLSYFDFSITNLLEFSFEKSFCDHLFYRVRLSHFLFERKVLDIRKYLCKKWHCTYDVNFNFSIRICVQKLWTVMSLLLFILFSCLCHKVIIQNWCLLKLLIWCKSFIFGPMMFISFQSFLFQEKRLAIKIQLLNCYIISLQHSAQSFFKSIHGPNIDDTGISS